MVRVCVILVVSYLLPKMDVITLSYLCFYIILQFELLLYFVLMSILSAYQWR